MPMVTRKAAQKVLEVLAAVIVLIILTGIVILVWRWIDQELEAHHILRLALLVVFVPITAGFLSATLEWLWYEVLCRRSLGTVSAYNPMKVIALGCTIIVAMVHALGWLYVVVGVLFLCRLVKRNLQESVRS
jgi:K+-sensing histidine kinase KdpD